MLTRWRLLITCFLLLTPTLLRGETLLLAEHLRQAQAGDFLVIAQSKSYTLFHIRNASNEQLTIEEISVPQSKIDTKKTSWRDWVKQGAPNRTSWVSYVIDLSTGHMQQRYAFTEEGRIKIDETDNFLSTLLNLKLHSVPHDERKRVGPPPSADELDRRQLWQPRLIVDGIVIPKVPFSAWHTRWPKDGSDLAGKSIEIYLPEASEKYPAYFPYWLQISGLVGKAKMHVKDSGRNLEMQ